MQATYEEIVDAQVARTVNDTLAMLDIEQQRAVDVRCVACLCGWRPPMFFFVIMSFTFTFICQVSIRADRGTFQALLQISWQDRVVFGSLNFYHHETRGRASIVPKILTQ